MVTLKERAEQVSTNTSSIRSRSSRKRLDLLRHPNPQPLPIRDPLDVDSSISSHYPLPSIYDAPNFVRAWSRSEFDISEKEIAEFDKCMYGSLR